MNFRVLTDIEAGQDVVWSFLNDHTKLPLWMPEVVETVYPNGLDPENAVGTPFRQTLREGNRNSTYEGEVTAYVAPRLMGLRLWGKSFTLAFTYALQPMGTGTRLDYQAAITLDSLFSRAVGYMFLPLTARTLTGHMSSLKQVAEEAAVSGGKR